MNSLPGWIAPVLVAIGPVVPVPLKNVIPAGAPPPPAEFASAALVIVISVALSIDAIFVSDEYDLPELTNIPTARLSVEVTVILKPPAK